MPSHCAAGGLRALCQRRRSAAVEVGGGDIAPPRVEHAGIDMSLHAEKVDGYLKYIPHNPQLGTISAPKLS